MAEITKELQAAIVAFAAGLDLDIASVQWNGHCLEMFQRPTETFPAGQPFVSAEFVSGSDTKLQWHDFEQKLDGCEPFAAFVPGLAGDKKRHKCRAHHRRPLKPMHKDGLLVSLTAERRKGMLHIDVNMHEPTYQSIIDGLSQLIPSISAVATPRMQPVKVDADFEDVPPLPLRFDRATVSIGYDYVGNDAVYVRFPEAMYSAQMTELLKALAQANHSVAGEKHGTGYCTMSVSFADSPSAAAQFANEAWIALARNLYAGDGITAEVNRIHAKAKDTPTREVLEGSVIAVMRRELSTDVRDVTYAKMAKEIIDVIEELYAL